MNETLGSILPPDVRRVLYVVVGLGATVFGIWQASDGKWDVFTGSLLVAIVQALAVKNVPAAPKEEP